MIMYMKKGKNMAMISNAYDNVCEVVMIQLRPAECHHR